MAHLQLSKKETSIMSWLKNNQYVPSAANVASGLKYVIEGAIQAYGRGDQEQFYDKMSNVILAEMNKSEQGSLVGSASRGRPQTGFSQPPVYGQQKNRQQPRKGGRPPWELSSNDQYGLDGRNNDWLREQLRANGIPTGGNKAELINKLTWWINEHMEG